MPRRTLSPGFPLDLGLTVGPLRRGRHDPTMRFAAGEVWRATRTPEGAVTMHVQIRAGRIEADAWGSGAAWSLDALPRLLGFEDDPAAFRPTHDALRRLHRRFAGLRLGRTDALVEALVPSIIEQKVAGMEAWRSYAALVRGLGEPAPGPGSLFLPPAPERLAGLPYHALHRFGIERRRATSLIRACAHAPRLSKLTLPEVAGRILLTLPGIGPWTIEYVAMRALGDPDAFPTTDLGIRHAVERLGHPGDRAAVAALAERWRPWRAYAVQHLWASLAADAPPAAEPTTTARA